jgi:acyl-CoA thioesterase YciA
MIIDVQAWARDRHRDDFRRVTEARFTFVAIDQDRKPRAVTEQVTPE